jgi:hypothetical protein
MSNSEVSTVVAEAKKMPTMTPPSSRVCTGRAPLTEAIR